LGVGGRLAGSGVSGRGFGGLLRLSWRGCGRVTGVMVAFEGVDGAGLTTHSRLLAEGLGGVLVEGRSVYVKEPTGGPVGSLVREVLASRLDRGLASPEALALLFAADRLGHLIGGDLAVVSGEGGEAGVLVLDRYKYSSIVYQSTVPLAGREPPPRWWVETVNLYAPPPHILVHLRVDPREAWRRVKARGDTQLYEDPSTLEMLADAFHRLIRELREKGEAVVEWGPDGVRARLPGGGEPLWTRLLPPCAYPQGRYPRIIEVDTTGRSAEEAALEVAEKVVGEMERLGLAEKA